MIDQLKLYIKVRYTLIYIKTHEEERLIEKINTVAKDLEGEFSEEKAKKIEKKYDCADVEFYWVHSIFVFIVFFTIIVFWWNTYPLNNLTYFPDENWSLFSYLLFLAVPFLMFMLCDVVAPQDHVGHHVD